MQKKPRFNPLPFFIFLAIIILTTFFGFLSVSKINEMNRSLNNMFENNLEPIVWITSARQNQIYLSHTIDQLPEVSDDADFVRLKNELSAYESEYLSNINLYRNTQLSEDEKRLLNQVDQMFFNYMETINMYLDLYQRKSPNSELKILQTELRYIFNNMDGAFKDIIYINRDAAYQVYQYTDISSMRDTAVMLALIVLIGIITVTVSLIFVTIESKRRMEIRLTESERRYRETADLLPTVVCETDKNLNLSYLNQTGKELFGIEEDAIKQSTLNVVKTLIVPEDESVFLSDINDAIHRRTNLHGLYRFLNRKKEIVDAILSVSIIQEKNLFIGVRMSIVPLERLMISALLPDTAFFSQYKLTEREIEIMNHILIGSKIKEIGEHFFISEATVKKHITHIYEKIGVGSREELFLIIRDYQKNKFGYDTFIFSLLQSLITK